MPKVSEQTLEDFKKLVRKAVFLGHGEEIYFQAIPNDKWASIFETNFNGNLSYAQRVILKQFRDIAKVDMPRVEAEKAKIANLERASKMITDAIDSQEPIVFVTDIDNDGSFSQSIINEYMRVDREGAANMIVQFSQTVNGNSARGITVDLVDKVVEHKRIDTDKPFLLITADNGINSRDEQMKIHDRYPNAKLIVTDHHIPEPGMVIEENERAVIFNPHYKPSEFYKKFNISGAATLGVLLRRVIDKRVNDAQLEAGKKNLENITNLSRIANLLDYVNTDPMDKPEKDHVVTKFLQLQGLMNVNNSLNRIILDGIPEKIIAQLKKTVPDLDGNVLRVESQNIKSQNVVAKILLKMYAEHRDDAHLTKEDFGGLFLKELNDPSNFAMGQEINENFIEQLRPLIFCLSVDDEKSAFLENLNENMVETFESIRASEKTLANELRKGKAIKKSSLPNSSIGYADQSVLSVFNRKFMGKVYNDENPGFLAMMDSVGKDKVSGSFRSLYDISEIFTEQDKRNLEFELGVKIETPGHEKAAGFIIKSADPETHPITPDTINAINKFINDQIAGLKAKEVDKNESHLLTDLSAIHLIDRINQAIRGNISNFERITSLLKLDENTIWTDSYTTEQFSMKDIADKKQFGYISINTDFHGGTVIVPVELVRRIAENNYQDYLAINYMDEGVFMAERVMPAAEAGTVIDLRGTNAKSADIAKVFATDFKDKNVVAINRDQIKDNPFYKYHDYGDMDFNLFERMVIGLIDKNDIDTLSVFDVEANGFGNGKLMNFGAMNYFIDEKSGERSSVEEFEALLYHNQRGEEFLLTEEQEAELVRVPAQVKPLLPLADRRQLLMKRNPRDGERDYDYYSHPGFAAAARAKKGASPLFKQVRNRAEIDGEVVYNREIRAEMLAFLVKDKDFKVPQEMTNLTGITQDLLDAYGKPTHVVDAEIAAYYKDKKALFGAHNTPYDSRILRANAPQTYETLRRSMIYDSALFCKEEKLAYDEVKVSNFVKVEGLPEGVCFYNNPHSDFNLTQFIKDAKNGYYPDRTGQKLLNCEEGAFYLIDKEKHESVKLQATGAELLASLRVESIPNTAVKYSVEKLSEQWMTHSLLISDEPFDIKYVDLNDPKHKALKAIEPALIYFQDNYLFDASPGANMGHFIFSHLASNDFDTASLDLEEFVSDFLELNKDIQRKFSDSWMYKSVLEIKDPTRAEVTNDLVDLVHYQTNLPKDKIRGIFADAIRFKEKYKIDHILQHEGHVNGPWEGDNKGDIAFEDKLTLSLLARRMYDPYASDIGDALERFNQASLKAKLAFDISHHMSDSAAHDSYSFRQGLMYQRDVKSGMISQIQGKEGKLAEKDEEHVVKFKLGNDVLPADTCVCAIARAGVALSREDIVKDAKMLDFILVNEQARSSLNNTPNPVARENLVSVLEANDSLSIEYKQELGKRYRFVEVNRRDGQLKKLLEAVIKCAKGSSVKAPKADGLNALSKEDIGIVKEILTGYVETMNKGRERAKQEDVEIAVEYLDKLARDAAPTRLESALADKTADFKSAFEVKDINFLKEVDIKRRDPIAMMLNKHPKLRLANRLVQKSLAEAEASGPGQKPRQRLI